MMLLGLLIWHLYWLLIRILFVLSSFLSFRKIRFSSFPCKGLKEKEFNKTLSHRSVIWHIDSREPANGLLIRQSYWDIKIVNFTCWLSWACGWVTNKTLSNWDIKIGDFSYWLLWTCEWVTNAFTVSILELNQTRNRHFSGQQKICFHLCDNVVTKCKKKYKTYNTSTATEPCLTSILFSIRHILLIYRTWFASNNVPALEHLSESLRKILGKKTH